MEYAEFLSWQAYYNVEPFGAGRDNFHAGIIASTIANCHSKKTWSADDFMIKDAQAKKQKNAQQFLAGLRTYAKKKPKNDGEPCPEKSS